MLRPEDGFGVGKGPQRLEIVRFNGLQTDRQRIVTQFSKDAGGYCHRLLGLRSLPRLLYMSDWTAAKRKPWSLNFQFGSKPFRAAERHCL